MARVGLGRGVRLAAVVVAALIGVFAVPAAAVATPSGGWGGWSNLGGVFAGL